MIPFKPSSVYEYGLILSIKIQPFSGNNYYYKNYYYNIACLRGREIKCLKRSFTYYVSRVAGGGLGMLTEEGGGGRWGLGVADVSKNS